MKTGDKYLDYKERNQEEKTINTSGTPITPTITKLTRPSITEENALRQGAIAQWTIIHKILQETKIVILTSRTRQPPMTLRELIEVHGKTN